MKPPSWLKSRGQFVSFCLAKIYQSSERACKLPYEMEICSFPGGWQIYHKIDLKPFNHPKNKRGRFQILRYFVMKIGLKTKWCDHCRAHVQNHITRVDIRQPYAVASTLLYRWHPLFCVLQSLAPGFCTLPLPSTLYPLPSPRLSTPSFFLLPSSSPTPLLSLYEGLLKKPFSFFSQAPHRVDTDTF